MCSWTIFRSEQAVSTIFPPYILPKGTYARKMALEMHGTSGYCPLLSIVIHCCPLLSIVIIHYDIHRLPLDSLELLNAAPYVLIEPQLCSAQRYVGLPSSMRIPHLDNHEGFEN